MAMNDLLILCRSHCRS